MPRSRLLVGLVAALSCCAALLVAPAAVAVTSTTAAPRCGSAAGRVPTVNHVVWVVFENKTLATFRSRSGAVPYLTGLTTDCGLATNYQATPYYGAKLAMTSGSNWGSTGDIKRVPGPDIFSQLGRNWTAYLGDMPSPCTTKNTPTFYGRHNPAAYYTDNASACTVRDLPLPGSPGALDLSRAFTYVEANVPQSMHGCPNLCPSGSFGQLSRGDTWASTWVEGILSSPQYLAGDTAVFVVWDQAGTADSNAPFIVLSPWTTPGYRTSTGFTHASLLRGTQELLGLPLLGDAASATSVASAFGLTGG